MKKNTILNLSPKDREKAILEIHKAITIIHEIKGEITGIKNELDIIAADL